MKEIDLNVEGMKCSGCENRVKNVLKSIDGVEEVEASHESGKVNIKLSKDVSWDEIKKAIEDLDFIVKE